MFEFIGRLWAAWRSRTIRAATQRDEDFLKIVQGADITGVTLPSGIKISDAGRWVVVGTKVVDIQEPLF